MFRTFSILALFFFSPSQGFSTNRKYDPVVFKGSDLPQLLDLPIDFIVGFAIISGKWRQIPIQIDEMHVQNWEIIKNGDCR